MDVWVDGLHLPTNERRTHPRQVGWIFAHPPREKGFVFSGLEVLTAAAEQLEAANGVAETPFVTIRVSLEQPEGKEEGEDGGEAAAGVPEMVTHFDAFQVSKQCMQMAAEGALELGPEPGSLAVNETFTAIVEGKGAKRVDTNFFLMNVPIGTCETTTFVNKFPRVSKEGNTHTHTHPHVPACFSLLAACWLVCSLA